MGQVVTSEEIRETWNFGGTVYTGCEVAARLMHKALTDAPTAVKVAAVMVYDNSDYDADLWLRQIECECDDKGIDDVIALRWFREQGLREAANRLARMGVA